MNVTLVSWEKKKHTDYVLRVWVRKTIATMVPRTRRFLFWSWVDKTEEDVEFEELVTVRGWSCWWDLYPSGKACGARLRDQLIEIFTRIEWGLHDAQRVDREPLNVISMPEGTVVSMDLVRASRKPRRGD
jgi:hypothetical protein